MKISRWGLLYKSLSMTVAVVMIFYLFTACSLSGSKDTSNTTSEATTAGTKAVGTTDTASGKPTPVTLSVFLDKPNVHPDWKWGDDMVSKKLTEITGVTLKMTYATTTNSEQFYTMLAAANDLPDFIYAKNITGPQATTLISQGFALALNELANKYSKDFFKWLPKDYEKIYGDEKGNIYGIGRDFGDITPERKVSAPMAVAGVIVNKTLNEKIGKPAMNTWDQVYEAAKKAKEVGGITYPIYMDNSSLKGPSMNSYSSAPQIINRTFGGTSAAWVQKDGNVLMNVRQDAYLATIKFLNKCYRAGLINPENFTVSKDEQWFDIAKRGQVFMFIGHAYNIFRATPDGQSETAMYWPVDFPAGPGIKHEDIKFRDYDASGIGSTSHGVFIMKNTKYPDRCIQYLTYMLSDEGQMLQWEGIEGVTYTEVNGVHKYTDERTKMEQENPTKTMTYYGYRNPNTLWTTNIWINARFRNIRGEAQPPYGDWCKIQADHLQMERLLDLTMNITKENDVVLQTKVLDVWGKAFAEMVLAGSENECISAYNKCIKDMEQAGLKQLEALYTANYKYWKGKGVEK